MPLLNRRHSISLRGLQPSKMSNGNEIFMSSFSLSSSLYRSTYPRHSTKKGLLQRLMGILNNKGQCEAWVVHYLATSPHGELHFILAHNRRDCLFIAACPRGFLPLLSTS